MKIEIPTPSHKHNSQHKCCSAFASMKFSRNRKKLAKNTFYHKIDIKNY